jgi:hypothetical protein
VLNGTLTIVIKFDNAENGALFDTLVHIIDHKLTERKDDGDTVDLSNIDKPEIEGVEVKIKDNVVFDDDQE